MVAKATYMKFTDSTFYSEVSPGYLMRLIHQMNVTKIDAALAEDGLTATQWITLVVLFYDYENTCIGLARRLGYDKGAMTRLIDQLEASGWVTRQRDEVDRRINRLSLTEAGRVAASAAKQKVIALWNGYLADWSDADVATLTTLLQRLRKTMEEDA